VEQVVAVMAEVIPQVVDLILVIMVLQVQPIQVAVAVGFTHFH
jgi:hypothetical protein